MPDAVADFIVIGGGMAGASAAYQLAAEASVILLEAEPQAGYHSTGRSAALFSKIYGNPIVRALSRASRPLYEAATGTLSDHPILSPRGEMHIARKDQLERLEALDLETGSVMRPLSVEEALERVPILRAEAVAAALYEETAAAIDVHALHQGYLGGLKNLGGRMAPDARVLELSRTGDGDWRVDTTIGVFRAPVVVNAAGAWADQVADAAGLGSIGLSPRRRCAAIVAPPPDVDVRHWPFTMDALETFYFGPFAGRLMLSGADETSVEPCDVQADEMELAMAVDRVERATNLQVRRLEHRWAGLRTFAPDRAPVVGYDPRAAGFFWLAGQGGYGIQTAPAMGLVAAALALGRPLPERVAAEGVAAADLAPDRLLAMVAS